MEGCPIHTPIPAMIRMFLDGQMTEGAQMVFANNPLSVICSLVCDHEKQCEGHCVKGIKGEPVHISSIENYISDTCFDKMKLEKKPWNGGGILRYGIPEFRLPKSILDRYYLKMKELGIRFRPNFALGGSTGVHDLLEDGYNAVFIGTGTWRPYRLNIPGETFGNVHYGINYLNNPDVYDLGDRVVVIGAGNAAMDVARTAIRKGSRYVTVYSVTEVPAASPKEVEYARIDGVQFEFLQTASRITDDGVMICNVEWDDRGQMVKHEETERFVPADSIIISISQGPQDRIVNRDKELKVDGRGLLKTNEKGETTMKGIFASGDIVTGAKTVVEAVKCSKMIADAMDEYVKASLSSSSSS